MKNGNSRAILNEVATCLASIWKQTAAPVIFRRSLFVHGAWIRITIEFDKSRNGDPPKRRAEGALEIQQAERSQDA